MTELEMWQAVSTSDRACDGLFWYGVRSTGIFCRPSCPSKRPNADNVRFFQSPADAESAGFRPCKRCQPHLASDTPDRALAEQIRMLIDAEFRDKQTLAAQIRALGVTAQYAGRLFKARYGRTVAHYADELRRQEAARLLEGGMPIVDVAAVLGFASLSAFYAFFGRESGQAPGRWRGVSQAEAQYCATYQTAIGAVTITADDGGITGITCAAVAAAGTPNGLTDRAAKQLNEYLRGERTQFTVPLNPDGTPFQRQVWDALCTIPYGQTRSYKQIAVQIGNPGASRAVGMANNRNPILILVPCHRVVGADGSLVGYAAGLPLKRQLLEMEAEHSKAD